jgi:hypothetical protein
MTRAKSTGKSTKKNIDDQIENLVNTMVKQVALLHLPRTPDGGSMDEDDIDGIVDIATIPVQEIIIGVLTATAIGYMGDSSDESEVAA